MMFNIQTKILIRWLLFSRTERAFIKLYDLHTESLFRLAMQLTAGDKPAAENIVQNTWFVAVEHLAAYSEIVL